MPGIQVVGMVNDSRRVPEILATTCVDVLLCDLHMPYLSGIDLTIREAVRAGVTGYALKPAGRNELEKAVTTLMQGQRYFSPDVMDQLARLNETSTADHDSLAALTDLEVDVLRLIADENTTHCIADKLFNCRQTVHEHLNGGNAPPTSNAEIRREKRSRDG